MEKLKEAMILLEETQRIATMKKADQQITDRLNLLWDILSDVEYEASTEGE